MARKIPSDYAMRYARDSVVSETSAKLANAVKSMPRDEARAALLSAASTLASVTPLEPIAPVRGAHTLGARVGTYSSNHSGLGGILASASQFGKDGGNPLALESDMPAIHESIEHEFAKDRISNFFKDPELERLKQSERRVGEHDRRVLEVANQLFDCFLKYSKEWQAPVGVPKTATNFELLAMNVARVAVGTRKLINELSAEKAITSDEEIEALHVIRSINQNIDRMVRATQDFLIPFLEDNGKLALTFVGNWFYSSFARLEIGHRLAASLCLTDVPADIEVRAPWDHWSLVVPEGLFPPITAGSTEHAARFWCVGSEPLYIITNEGHAICVLGHPDRQHGVIYETMRALIRGACLVVSGHPEDFKKVVAQVNS